MVKGTDDKDIHSDSDTSLEQRGLAFRHMFSYARPHRINFGLILFFIILSVLADLTLPYLIKIAIDEGFLSGEHGLLKLGILSLCYLGLTVIVLLLGYWQVKLLQQIGQSIVAKLRKDLFRHITAMSMSFFDRNHSGSLVTNESSDTETISQFFTQVLLSLMRDGLSLIIIFGFMFVLDPRIAFYCLFILPVMAIISMMFRNLLRSAYRQSRTQLSRLIAFLAENLAGMGLVQAYYQEREQLNLFVNRNRRYFKESTREIRATVLFNRTFDIFGNLTIAAVVWIGGYAVFDQQMEFGVLFAFITYIRQFFVPVNQMTQQWNTLQSTLVSMDRLWRIFSQQPEVKDPSQGTERHLELRNVMGRVDFEQVWFSYDEVTDVIRELNLHVKPGEFVGIVGTTGAGKSSLVNLLTRFYDVKSGRITIDGVDIRHVPLEELNRIVGLVQQEPFLYSGSIIDNVRMFHSNIPRDKVVEACKIIGAESMIQRLHAGYNTRLSDRGSGLSAGERQLISFARILVFEPRILILDEATANLDSHTERMIQQALETVSRGRTTLVIAHRLSTIQHADRIIVVKEGRIIEEGNHRQLMGLDGHYAELQRHAIQSLTV